MKHKTLWQLLLGTVFGGALGLAVIGCLVSAYGFSVNLWTVGIFCLAAAFFRSLPKGQYIAGPLLAVAAVWLLVSGVLIDSVEGLLFRISEIYDKGYGWGVLRWSDLEEAALDAALPAVLYLLGSLLSLLTARAVGGKSCVFPVVVTLLLLGACFVVTDKVPDTAWVFLTFFVGAMLLLSALLGKQNKPQSQRLLLWYALPVFFCVLLLFAFVPKNGYDGAARAEKWTEEIIALWDRLNGRFPEVSGVDTVDLSDVGRRSYFHSEVMQVTARADGKLYLRGRAFDTYDGRSWQDSGENPKLPWPNGLEDIGEVTIATKYVHHMLYLPYYTQSLDMTQYPSGKVNEFKFREYSVSCGRLPSEARLEALNPDPYTNLHTVAVDLTLLTALPSGTHRWARQTVEEIAGGKQSWYHIAKEIEAYVENSATYDLKTDRMPLGQSDFARWFLEDGETGYCVHFATAAAVLLRSAGIPARYVTGYMVDVKADEPTAVTDADAHAWVEYWLPAFGWVVLEATPASYAPSVDATETRPTTEPTQTHTERDETHTPEDTTREAPAVLWWVLGVFGFVLVLWLQRKVRLYFIKQDLFRGSTNERALKRWYYLTRCHKYLPAPPEAQTLELAEKAKFSQYTITREELAQLDKALKTAHAALKRRNIFLQIYFRIVLALY